MENNYIEEVMETMEAAEGLLNETVEATVPALTDVAESALTEAAPALDVTAAVVEEAAKDPSIVDILVKSGEVVLVGAGAFYLGKQAVKGGKWLWNKGVELYNGHKAKKDAKRKDRVEVLVEDADTEVKPVDPDRVAVEPKKGSKK